MWRIRERLAMFMHGRYGNDKFNIALLVLYLIVAIINTIARNIFATSIFFLVQWTILIMVLFRSLSRNIPARRRENDWFERNFYKFNNHFKLLGRRIRDAKYKRYRKCPHCKAVVRLPIRRGKHTVKCPSCNIEFKVRIII